MDEIATPQLRQVPGVGSSRDRELPELPCILVGREEVDGVSVLLNSLDDVTLHGGHTALRIDTGTKHEDFRYRHLLGRPSRAEFGS